MKRSDTKWILVIFLGLVFWIGFILGQYSGIKKLISEARISYCQSNGTDCVLTSQKFGAQKIVCKEGHACTVINQK